MAHSIEETVGPLWMTPESERPALWQAAVGGWGVESVVGADPGKTRPHEVNKAERPATWFPVDPAKVPIGKIRLRNEAESTIVASHRLTECLDEGAKRIGAEVEDAVLGVRRVEAA